MKLQRQAQPQQTPAAPSPAEVLALSKLLSGGEDVRAMLASAREAVAPGQHLVDFTVHVRGALKVNADTTATMPMMADPWGLLALALSKLNSATVESLVIEHETRLGAGEKVDVQTVKEAAAEALRRIKATTTGHRKGAVTAVLEVTVLK